MILSALRRILASILVVAMVAAPFSQLAARADACAPETMCQMGSSCCCAAAVDVEPGSSALTQKGCDCEVSRSETPAEPPLSATLTQNFDTHPAETPQAPVAPLATDEHRSTQAQNLGPPGEHSPPRYISNCSLLI